MIVPLRDLHGQDRQRRVIDRGRMHVNRPVGLLDVTMPGVTMPGGIALGDLATVLRTVGMGMPMNGELGVMIRQHVVHLNRQRTCRRSQKGDDGNEAMSVAAADHR